MMFSSMMCFPLFKLRKENLDGICQKHQKTFRAEKNRLQSHLSSYKCFHDEAILTLMKFVQITYMERFSKSIIFKNMTKAFFFEKIRRSSQSLHFFFFFGILFRINKMRQMPEKGVDRPQKHNTIHYKAHKQKTTIHLSQKFTLIQKTNMLYLFFIYKTRAQIFSRSCRIQTKTAGRLRGLIQGLQMKQELILCFLGRFFVLIPRFVIYTYNKKLKPSITQQMNVCFDITQDSKPQASKQRQNKSFLKMDDFQLSSSYVPAEKSHGQKRRYLKESEYNWNDTQNRRYINFLMKHGDFLLLPNQQKKKLKVNVLMSRCVRTRNSTQCHTHHQKMMQKYGSIPRIIAEYSSLPSTSKKGEKSIVGSQEVSALQYNNFVIQNEQCYSEPSFLKEYLMPVATFEQKEEFLDFVWEL